MRIFSLMLFLGFTCLLSSCSWFGNDEAYKPAELVKFDEEVSLKKKWSTDVSKGQGSKFNRLMPALDGETIFVASVNGHVAAFNRENGSRIWRNKTDYSITGGVGVGNGMVLLGTENAQVLALDSSSGEILWVEQVPSEILSVPQTDGELVIVQTIDGKLVALDSRNGQTLWLYENTVPALTLRGDSSPLVVGDFVLAAFANGNLVSVAMDNGTLRWEERIAIPTGRSEIERMVDIDGRLHLDDDGNIVVSSYQGYLVLVDVTTGRTRWRVKESSSSGASSGFGNIYISDEIGHVKAYRAGQDEPIWINDQLDRRQLTSPLAFSNYVAVADFEGYVHFLSQVDGRFVGRIKVDGSGVRADMFAANNILYVYGNSGKLVAIEIR